MDARLEPSMEALQNYSRFSALQIFGFKRLTADRNCSCANQQALSEDVLLPLRSQNGISLGSPNSLTSGCRDRFSSGGVLSGRLGCGFFFGFARSFGSRFSCSTTKESDSRFSPDSVFHSFESRRPTT